MLDDSMNGPTSAVTELANDFVKDDPTLPHGHAAVFADAVIVALARAKPDAPLRHSKQTPACVPMSRFRAVQRGKGRFTPAEEGHFVGCEFCQRNRNVFFTPEVKTAPAGRGAAGDETAAGNDSEDDIAAISTGPKRPAERSRDPGLSRELDEALSQPLSPAPAVVPGAAPEPRLIGGRYDVLAQLGSGGMGIVYRATDRASGREVAVKVMRTTARADARAVARFRREAGALMAVKHPNVVPLLDAAIDRGRRPCVVTPLCRGETLDDRLQTGPWPVRSVAEIACQIADGLAAVHAAGVCHRDLKPSNIILSYEGGGRTVRILDFGLARASTPAGTASPRARAERLMGTAGYMAPEQARGEPGDGPSDVFALGVILCRMMFDTADAPVAAEPSRGAARFCGQPESPGRLVVFAHQQFDALLEDALRSDTPQSAPERRLCALTQAALAPDPGARPPARMLADELRALLPAEARIGTCGPAGPQVPTIPERPELWAELCVAVRLIATCLTGRYRTVFVDADEIAQEVLTDLVRRAARDSNLLTDLTSPARDHLLAEYCENALRDARQAESYRHEFRRSLPDAGQVGVEFPIFSRPLFSERFPGRRRTLPPPEPEVPDAPRLDTDVDRSLLLEKVLGQPPGRARALLEQLRRDRSPGKIAATLAIS